MISAFSHFSARLGLGANSIAASPSTPIATIANTIMNPVESPNMMNRFLLKESEKLTYEIGIFPLFAGERTGYQRSCPYSPKNTRCLSLLVSRTAPQPAPPYRQGSKSRLDQLMYSAKFTLNVQ